MRALAVLHGPRQCSWCFFSNHINDRGKEARESVAVLTRDREGEREKDGGVEHGEPRTHRLNRSHSHSRVYYNFEGFTTVMCKLPCPLVTHVSI